MEVAEVCFLGCCLALHVAFATVPGHKMCGPTGIGFLLLSRTLVFAAGHASFIPPRSNPLQARGKPVTRASAALRPVAQVGSGRDPPRVTSVPGWRGDDRPGDPGRLALGFETWGVSTLRCPTARAGSTFNDIPHKFEAGASSHVPWPTREKERGSRPRARCSEAGTPAFAEAVALGAACEQPGPAGRSPRGQSRLISGALKPDCGF